MPPKSISRESKKKEVQDAESDASNSNNIASPKPSINAKSNARKIESLSPSNSNDSASIKSTNKKQPRKRTGDTSTSTTNSTTNEPSSTSTSIVRAGQPVAAAAEATTAPTSTVPLSGQKKRKAGFREQFLQKLRVMLDRESQNDDTTVQWSTDGNSFIITDQTQFEEEIIPTYFGNPIVFASFLRKLQRWDFVRLSSKRSGRYEFSSPTFKRMDSRGKPAAAGGDAATTNVAVNDGRGTSIPFPQQQQQAMTQLNRQPTTPVPNQLPRQEDASAIADRISNIQHLRSTQQPPTSSPQPGPNQVTNQMQMNLADINSILQNIIGSNQHQPVSSQNSVPNQQPTPNLTSLLNNASGNNHLQSFPQWQHPNNPTMNLLNAALQSMGRGPTPSARAMGQYPVPSAQSSAVHALMSLSGMLPQSPPLNTTPVASGMSTAASSQPNGMSRVLSLLQILQRFIDEEYQRRAQADAVQNAILATIGRILGQGFHNNNTAQPQQVGAPLLSWQSLGSNNNNVAEPNQLGARHPSVGCNTQADSIAAILQAAQRGDATAQPEENARAQNYGPVNDNSNDSEDDMDEDSEEEDEHHSTKRRKSSPEDQDQYDSNDDSWNERLRPRKEFP